MITTEFLLMKEKSQLFDKLCALATALLFHLYIIHKKISKI